MGTFMIQLVLFFFLWRKLGWINGDRINGIVHLLVNGRYWGLYTNLLLSFGDTTCQCTVSYEKPPPPPKATWGWIFERWHVAVDQACQTSPPCIFVVTQKIGQILPIDVAKSPWYLPLFLEDLNRLVELLFINPTGVMLITWCFAASLVSLVVTNLSNIEITAMWETL